MEKKENIKICKLNMDKVTEKISSNTTFVAKKKLTPYQEFLLNKNAGYERYKQKYFEYYDDVKDKTHRIYDW